MLGGSQTWWSSQQWMKGSLTNLVMFCFREKSVRFLYNASTAYGIKFWPCVT